MNADTIRQASIAYLERIPLSEMPSKAYPRQATEVLYGVQIVTSEQVREVQEEWRAMRREGILNFYSHYGWYVVGGRNDRGAAGNPLWDLPAGSVTI